MSTISLLSSQTLGKRSSGAQTYMLPLIGKVTFSQTKAGYVADSPLLGTFRGATPEEVMQKIRAAGRAHVQTTTKPDNIKASAGTTLPDWARPKDLFGKPAPLKPPALPAANTIDRVFAQRQPFLEEDYLSRKRQAMEKLLSTPGTLEHSMRTVDRELHLTPKQRQYVKDYLTAVGAKQVRQAIQLAKQGNFAMLRAVGNPQRLVDEQHKEVRIDDWVVALKKGLPLVGTRDKQGQMLVSKVTKRMAKRMGVPPEWLARNPKFAIAFFKLTNPGPYVKGPGETLDAWTQRMADAVPDDNLGIYLRSLPAAFELFPNAVQEATGQAMGLKQGQVTADPDIQKHWGTQLGTAGFNAVKYAINAPVSLGSDLLAVSQRMREVGFKQTMSEVGRGLVESTNPFSKGIDPIERGVRSINLLATILGAYKVGVKGGAQVALMRRYKFTPRQAALVIDAAEAARKAQAIGKGSIRGTFEGLMSDLSPRQLKRTAESLAANPQVRKMLDSAPPSKRSQTARELRDRFAAKRAELIAKATASNAAFRRAMARRWRQIGAAYMPIYDLGANAMAVAQWTSDSSLSIAQAMERLGVPNELREKTAQAAQALIKKGAHRQPEYVSEEDLRRVLERKDIHVTSFDTSVYGIADKDGPIGHGGIGATAHTGVLSMGHGPADRILKHMDGKPGTLVVIANSRKNNLASHGSVGLKHILENMAKDSGPEAVTNAILAIVPSKGRIRDRLARVLTPKGINIDGFIAVVRTLPSAMRKKLIHTMLETAKQHNLAFPSVERMLHLITDPNNQNTELGDILGVYDIDPTRPLVPTRLHPNYDTNVPVQHGGRVPEGYSVFGLPLRLKGRDLTPNRMRWAVSRGDKIPFDQGVWEAMIEDILKRYRQRK